MNKNQLNTPMHRSLVLYKGVNMISDLYFYWMINAFFMSKMSPGFNLSYIIATTDHKRYYDNNFLWNMTHLYHRYIFITLTPIYPCSLCDAQIKCDYTAIFIFWWSDYDVMNSNAQTGFPVMSIAHMIRVLITIFKAVKLV